MWQVQLFPPNPPTVHFTCPQSLSWAQPAVITYHSDVLIANEEQKKWPFMAQPQAPSVPLWVIAPIYAPLLLSCCCFCSSYFCCFCFALPYCQPESQQRSKIVTELQYEVFELCLCEFWCIAACNHVHASKKLFRASEPIRVSNRKLTCKYSIVEFLACANLIKKKNLLYHPHSIWLKTRDSQSHNQ